MGGGSPSWRSDIKFPPRAPMSLVQQVVPAVSVHPPWPHRHRFDPELFTLKLLVLVVVSVLITISVALRSWLKRKHHGRPQASTRSKERKR